MRDWTCTICGKGRVDEDVESSDYCFKVNIPGHRQTCHETKVSEDSVCEPCHAAGVGYYGVGIDEIGSAGLIAIGSQSGRVSGYWGYGIGSSYGADYGPIDFVGSRGQPTGYYENQWTQEGASKEGLKKKSKKASWNADKKAKAAATTNAQDNMGLAQSSTEVKASGSVEEEPSPFVRSETDAKASTSLNAEATVFVQGAWRHGA